jgi:FtsP/CotA-like multicopper oxidase with cupredoxin domain
MKLLIFKYRTLYSFLLIGLSICIALTVAHGQHIHDAVKNSTDSKLTKSNLNKSDPKTPNAAKESYFGQQISPVIEGKRTIWQYELIISETEHKLQNGAMYKVWAYSGQVPAPTLVAREGDWVRIRLINETSVNHTIHSHGLYVPQRMDGVPHDHGNDQQNHNNPAASKDEFMPRPVAPGESFTYEYIARPAGTHWYHCHINTNEHLNRGMAGALIVLPRVPEPKVDHDLIMLLQEWNSRYAQGGTPGNPKELNDYDFFTINGKSFPETKAVQVELGETVRIRFINAGALPHSMHLHGHSFLVTHKDGFPLAEPAEMDTVLIGPGERVDIIILANNPGDWPLHCHTAAHQTNNGLYPGGMMTHLKVGKISSPKEGDGPIGKDLRSLRAAWRLSAHKYLGIAP